MLSSEIFFELYSKNEFLICQHYLIFEKLISLNQNTKKKKKKYHFQFENIGLILKNGKV